MEAQLQEHILVCGQPWTGKVAGNSTDSATLVCSVDCPDGCDPCRILQAPRTLFSAGVSAVIQLGLTPVTDLEHRQACGTAADACRLPLHSFTEGHRGSRDCQTLGLSRYLEGAWVGQDCPSATQLLSFWPLSRQTAAVWGPVACLEMGHEKGLIIKRGCREDRRSAQMAFSGQSATL